MNKSDKPHHAVFCNFDNLKFRWVNFVRQAISSPVRLFKIHAKINTQSNLTNKFTENTPLKSQKKAQSMKVPFIATKVDRFIEINLARCRKISHAAFFRDSVPTRNLYSEIDKVTFSKQNIYFGQLFASVKCSKLIILLIEVVQ